MVFQRQITMTGSLMLGLLGSLVSGCTETVIHDSWSDLKQLRGEDRSFWQRPAHASLSSQHEDRRRWAILLRRFEGADQHEQARGLLKRLRHEVRLTDVWVQEAAARTLVYRGWYADPLSAEALASHRQTRMIKLDGQRPFRHVQIEPVVSGTVAVAGPYDLRQYRGQYTLQVEVYDDVIAGNYREVAEERAHALREVGDQAFYYHGPFRSMVTVGLFTRKQAFVRRDTTEVYSPVVLKLQKKYPLNLYNGRTVVEKSRGKKIGEQTSSLVIVP